MLYIYIYIYMHMEYTSIYMYSYIACCIYVTWSIQSTLQSLERVIVFSVISYVISDSRKHASFARGKIHNALRN